MINLFIIFSIWYLVANISDYLLALTPASIPVTYKKALYYLIVWPEMTINSLKELLGKYSGHLFAITNWFRE